MALKGNNPELLQLLYNTAIPVGRSLHAARPECKKAMAHLHSQLRVVVQLHSTKRSLIRSLLLGQSARRLWPTRTAKGGGPTPLHKKISSPRSPKPPSNVKLAVSNKMPECISASYREIYKTSRSEYISCTSNIEAITCHGVL